MRSFRPHPVTIALLAFSLAVLLDAIEHMAPNAVRGFGIDRGGPAVSQHVNAHCDRFHVRRVYARPIAAKMVDGEPCRNWATGQLVSEPVCLSGFSVNLETSVSSALSPGPDPTPVAFDNVCPEAGLWGAAPQRHRCSRATPTPVHVMALTQTKPSASVFAPCYRAIRNRLSHNTKYT